MKGVKVYKPAPTLISTWAFLTMGNAPQDLVKVNVGKFAVFMKNNMGIPINTAPAGSQQAQSKREEDLRNAFQTLVKKTPRLQFVVVVLPIKETSTYNAVKKIADVEFGVATVCVRQEMLLKEKGQFGYFANVGLKVNLKFGGANHRVKDTTGLVQNTMFVGYDVTHPTNLPAGAAENAPSFIGLVASRDEDLAQWPAVTWATTGRVENVAKGEDKGRQFVEHFKERIRLWQNHNKRPLKNIIIFRDGVSEGQFKMVLTDELPHIRNACRQMFSANEQPRLSLIVSVKRHQTRFYPTNPAYIHSKSKSPKEGTIVDRGVTNVRYWDFFLQAHASLQGKPSHTSIQRVTTRLTKSHHRHRPSRALHRPPRRDLPSAVRPQGRRRAREAHARHVLRLRPRHQGCQHLPAGVLCGSGRRARPHPQERAV
jgi:hypothetical protein